MFFDDFQNAPPPPSRPGWTIYGGAGQGHSGTLALKPGMKMVAGDAKWTDYVLEGRVMLKSEQRGNAGLIFRVNDAGPGYNQMRGYYVGLDTRNLYLGKMATDLTRRRQLDGGAILFHVEGGRTSTTRAAVGCLRRGHGSPCPVATTTTPFIGRAELRLFAFSERLGGPGARKIALGSSWRHLLECIQNPVGLGAMGDCSIKQRTLSSAHRG